MSAANKRVRWVLRLIVYLLAAALTGLALLLGYLWFASLGLNGRRLAAPQRDYEGATDAVRRLADRKGQAVNPLCHTRLLGQGKKTAQAVVIFHGISNCPHQFAAIAEALHAEGLNVLLARLPRQGMADRLSDEPALATAEEAVLLAQEMVDIAHGLGDEVIVAGMSGGGVLAAWLAQNREDIARVVLIAPMFGVQAFPAALMRPISTAVRMLPNWWGWFDPERREQLAGPKHGYPRYSSRTVAEYLRLGAQVAADAEARPPAVKDICILGNLNDETVRPEMHRAVAAAWRRHGASVFVYDFPIAAGLKHDLIDPAQPDQATEIVHPYVLSLIVAQQPAAP